MDSLIVKDMGIDTHQEPVMYMRRDCHVCRAEGFSASTRVAVIHRGQSVIASMNVVDESVLAQGYAGFSKVAMQRLQVEEGDFVTVGHAPVLESMQSVRKKIFGHKLSTAEVNAIIGDISAHRYSDIEIASFLSVCAGSRLDVDEIIDVTDAMVGCGKRLVWPKYPRVFDKHCIGGLPGNRTTPLLVSIASAAGLVMPKTSSRAITSPAGTADTMEALTNVNLAIVDIQRTVAATGACLSWGGAVNLSPADDLMIRVERALDLDGEGQLIASVLSKKIAAGSTHVLIDIPVGETAKVRSQRDANRLASLFTQVGAACGIVLRCVLTDGSQPVGLGIGPVEEARDLLAVLQGHADAPWDLRERALKLTAQLFDLADAEGVEAGYRKAEEILQSGQAWDQFQHIVAAQGGLKTLPDSRYQHIEYAPAGGRISRVDNRQLARLAKLAGAPSTPAAGVRLHVRTGDLVAVGSPLFTLFSNSTGERNYALEYFRNQSSIFAIEDAR